MYPKSGLRYPPWSKVSYVDTCFNCPAPLGVAYIQSPIPDSPVSNLNNLPEPYIHLSTTLNSCKDSGPCLRMDATCAGLGFPEECCGNPTDILLIQTLLNRQLHVHPHKILGASTTVMDKRGSTFVLLESMLWLTTKSL